MTADDSHPSRPEALLPGKTQNTNSKEGRIMMTQKVFHCQKCDAEIEVNNLSDKARVRCRSCGEVFILTYDEQTSSWMLRVDEPVAKDEDFHPEEEQFSVLGEVSRPAKIDRSEQYREQSSRHSDDEAGARRPASNPEKL